MNTFKKITVSAVLGAAAVSAAPVQAADLSGMLMTEVTSAMAEAAQTIARVAADQLRSALQAPRVMRTRTSPSVTISEGTTGPIVVEATRLPPLDAVADERIRSAQNAEVRF
jgi:hypothetical protein